AVQYMAKRRIGALIVFEKETGLQDYIETGIAMDTNISQDQMQETINVMNQIHEILLKEAHND
ncbi:diadenylate cyclase, partial [Staphylococcus aureus]|uniref:diadenylate cyclase n=1 Tax=Staphylococcus aureus TaxID=1280 RepID=UPI003D6B1C6B